MHNSYILQQYVCYTTILNMFLLRRTNCITTASGVVNLCKQPYSKQVESGLNPLSTCILHGFTSPPKEGK